VHKQLLDLRHKLQFVGGAVFFGPATTQRPNFALEETAVQVENRAWLCGKTSVDSICENKTDMSLLFVLGFMAILS
jgi:hypothetical protein